MFRDRIEAGRQLAEKLAQRVWTNGLVLGIPRGGVVVAAQVAAKLGLPLDVLVTRKIGAPHNGELAIGAVMPDGTAILDEEMIRAYAIPPAYLNRAIKEETERIRQRLALYRGERPLPLWAGRTVIVVDDGIATGCTMRAALTWLADSGAAGLVVAVPVAPPDVVAALAAEVDAVITLAEPTPFYAVGMYYEDFSQTTDDQVIAILQPKVAAPAARAAAKQTEAEQRR